MSEECYICEFPISVFITTPILELPDGRLVQCCKKCADENFPNWEDDDESGL